mgnify:CR=1 FL=1
MDASDVAPKGEIKTIGLVSIAHLLSHLYMLALPPLFPQLREDFMEYCDSQNLDAILEPVKN